MPVEELLGYRFKNRLLLEEALTHPSRTRQVQNAAFNYQRLEFVGDAVLGLVVAHMLFEAFPDESEGHLAKRHAALVRSEAIAQVGQGLGISRHIIMASSEEVSGGRSNLSNIEDVCEALIGAIYLDGGFDPASMFVRMHWSPLVSAQGLPPRDAKTSLQEWAQGQGKKLPVYTVVHTEGPSHAPLFTIEVSVEGLAPVTASGASKRAAEQKAAQMLMETLPL